MSECKLVGTLSITPGNVVSINVGGSSDASIMDGTLIKGASIGTVNVTGYASNSIFTGDVGRAGVSIEWARKIDCDFPGVYLLFGGAKGYVSGGASIYASVDIATDTVSTLDASAVAGPSAIYGDSTTTFGVGFSYTGGPISIVAPATGPPDPVSLGGMVGLYLQSFTLQCNPGSVAMASYSFMFINSETGVG